jgi:hypothetical protein
MKVRLRVLDNGTRVRIRQPRAGERGIWIIRGRVAGSGLDDPAYDLDHERTGRARVLRPSRLRLVRPTPPCRPVAARTHIGTGHDSPNGFASPLSRPGPAAPTGGSSDEARP